MILVTGGTGFVGTYLLYELLKGNSPVKSTYRKEKNKELTKDFFKLKDKNHPKLLIK
ncbi:MAG: SDR family oxidoreductase [Flavobacteriaceae bacterium]